MELSTRHGEHLHSSVESLLKTAQFGTSIRSVWLPRTDLQCIEVGVLGGVPSVSRNVGHQNDLAGHGYSEVCGHLHRELCGLLESKVCGYHDS